MSRKSQPETPDWLTRLRRAIRWVETRVPPGLRSLLGLLLMVGGVFGMLPILGFWMFPLGVALIWIDLRALWRHFRHG